MRKLSINDYYFQGIDTFKIGLSELGITLEESQIKQFMNYYELLNEWNKVMNLTAITELEEVITKHFIDSLSLIKVIKLKKERLIDIGTGAGFPGIPLKITFPELQVVLIDSLKKRVGFLEEVIRCLGLKNITVLHGRAEDFGRNRDYRESFDVCVSRAVARLSVLSEYCLPYVKVGGYFIPYKSGEVTEELNEAERAISILGAEIERVDKFILPGSEIDRSLILITKKKATSTKYPRIAGKPSKEPL